MRLKLTVYFDTGVGFKCATNSMFVTLLKSLGAVVKLCIDPHQDFVILYVYYSVNYYPSHTPQLEWMLEPSSPFTYDYHHCCCCFASLLVYHTS